MLPGGPYWSYGAWKREPRDASDFVGFADVPCAGDKCVDDLVAGDLVVTEIMFNPSTDLGDDKYNEWIEVYNASGGSVNLEGLTIEDDGGNTGTVAQLDPTATLAAGDYAVLATSDGASWAYPFTPFAYYGGNPGWGNSGDQPILKNGTDTIDTGAAYPKDVTEAGTSWQLGGTPTSAASSDEANWCASTSAIDGVSGEYGTPSAANDGC